MTYRCMDYYININRRISFDFNDTLLFHNYTSLWKAFKFRSPKYFIQSETISISLPISTPSPDSNILHRQLYVAYTSSPKYFTHPINNTQNISIPSFKPFPNSLSTFLISTLHVSYTRFHKLNPYSVYYYLVVAQQLKTMRFNLPPSLSPQTQTNSTGGGSGKLHAPRRLSFPGNRDIRHDDPTTWPVHRSWTSRPRNVKIVRRWSWGFQVGATSFREFTDTRERVGKIMLRSTRPPPAVTIREGLHALLQRGRRRRRRRNANCRGNGALHANGRARRRGGQVCGSLRPPSCFAGTLHACCDNPWSGIQTFARPTSRKTTFPLVSVEYDGIRPCSGSVKRTFAKLGRKADKTVR